MDFASPRKNSNPTDARLDPRVRSLRGISVSYEGHSEEWIVRPPDVSRHGMFLATTHTFPEGAVLNLKFQLAITGAEIETRGEVRYCLKGVGVGIEFLGISPDAMRKIEREVQLCEKTAGPKSSSPKRAAPKGSPQKRGSRGKRVLAAAGR